MQFERLCVKPDFSIVIPAYNEESSLPFLFEALEKYVSTSPIDLQFVFVDDGSSDNTLQCIKTWKCPGAHVKVIKLSRNYGAHPAIRAGVKHSDSDFVMLYSADMPEPVDSITAFFNELRNGYEIVYSERIGYKGSLGSRVFGKMINRYIEESYPTNGLIGVAFGNKVKDELNRDTSTNSSIFFQIFQMGFSRKSIPIQYNEREQGESKWTFTKKVTLFIDSFVMFSYAPIKAISALGFLMAVVGILGALLIVLFKLLNITEFAAGWPTVLCLLLAGFGVTNISLGIIAEYLGRTLEASRGKSTFIVDEVVELES